MSVELSVGCAILSFRSLKFQSPHAYWEIIGWLKGWKTGTKYTIRYGMVWYITQNINGIYVLFRNSRLSHFHSLLVIIPGR